MTKETDPVENVQESGLLNIKREFNKVVEKEFFTMRRTV